MKDYGLVRSTIRPQPLVIDELSVWEHTDITPVTENEGTEQEFVGFEYRMVQYSKDEYILLQTEENASLQEQLTDTQVALCDVYELLVAGGEA